MNELLYFEPFGRRWTGAPGGVASSTISLGLTAHMLDDELGLTAMGGRFYDQASRRFLTPDPLLPESRRGSFLDRYKYALGDPANVGDVFGFQAGAPGDYIAEDAGPCIGDCGGTAIGAAGGLSAGAEVYVPDVVAGPMDQGGEMTSAPLSLSVLSQAVRTFVLDLIEGGRSLPAVIAEATAEMNTEASGSATVGIPTLLSAGNHDSLGGGESDAKLRRRADESGQGRHRDLAWVKGRLAAYDRELQSAKWPMHLMCKYHQGGARHDYWKRNPHDTFEVPGPGGPLTAAQFGNYIAGWAAGRVPASRGSSYREVGATFLALQLVLGAGAFYDLYGDVHFPLDWDSKPYIYWGFSNGLEGFGADSSSSLRPSVFYRSPPCSTLADGERVRAAGYPLFPTLNNHAW